MSASRVAEHYRRIAERYTDYLSYSDEFVPTLAAKMIAMLDLQPTDHFVDLGGGSGIYTAAILDQLTLDSPPLIVDYFAEMLEQVPNDLPAAKACMGALEFAAEPRRYDKVLIKETIHHVEDRALLVERLFHNLRPGGALLLVHVPPDLDYPLFDAALRRARSWHADPDELTSIMEAVGFRTDRDAVDWRHRLPQERYRQMVASRYMSVLSSFSDDELRAGLDEMAERWAGVEVLDFVDHFDFIVGRKEA